MTDSNFTRGDIDASGMQESMQQNEAWLEQANQDDMSENNIMSWEEAYGL